MKRTLKQWQILALLLMLCAILPAAPLDTYHSGWKLIRETADEDAADFATVYDLTTSGDFANKNSSSVANGGPYHIRSYQGRGDGTEFQSSGAAWMFAICGKNYNGVNDTFSFNVIGWSRINGMLQTVCEGDGVLGTQAVMIYPDGDEADIDLIDDNTAAFTNAGKIFTTTNGAFANAKLNTMAYVVSTNANLTSGYYEITTVTDANSIAMSGATSSGNATSGEVTVQSNPSFWADTITLDETTKWPSVAVFNSADNEMAFLVIDTAGLEWVQFVVYAADAATNEEAGAITVYGRLY